MSGFTILKAKILLKYPVDSAIDRGLRLLTPSDGKVCDDKIVDPADQEFLDTWPFWQMQGRLTYDGRYVVVDAELKNKRHELEAFLSWLAPSIQQVEDGSWDDEEGLDDEPLDLSFEGDPGKFLLRGPGFARDLTTEPWQPTATP